MSGSKRSKCDHESGLHRYKKFLTAKNKPIWHCVDCSSRANFDMAIITNVARCNDCGALFGLSLDRLHSDKGTKKLGLIDGISITCGHPECDDRKAEAARKLYAEKLVGKVMDKLRAAPGSRSEPEQDGEALLLSMMKGEG